jgi:hypothetical protein
MIRNGPQVTVNQMPAAATPCAVCGKYSATVSQFLLEPRSSDGRHAQCGVALSL